MKKIMIALGLAMLFLNACSKSDTPDQTPVDVNAVFLKKVVYNDGVSSVTSNYAYSNNKITSITYSNNEKSIYTYTGNLITKNEHYLGTTLDYTENFTYDSNNNLVTYTEISGASGYKETYVHNTNGTISYATYSGNNVSQTTLGSTGLFTMQNGEVISKTVVSGANTATYNYTYDAKYCPFKNVLGFDKIVFRDDYLEFGNQKNRLGYTYSNPAFPSSNKTVTVAYTYNADNFPTNSTTTNNGSIDATIQYSY